jgi:tetratricopeptide (TPR) repeat protein
VRLPFNLPEICHSEDHRLRELASALEKRCRHCGHHLASAFDPSPKQSVRCNNGLVRHTFANVANSARSPDLDVALDHIAASANTAAISEQALRSEMALRMAVVFADYYTKGKGLNPERQLQRARDIARNIGDKTQELKALWMLYGWAGNVGDYRQELLYAQQFVATARESADHAAESRCNRMLARGLSHLGQHTCAQKHIEHALRCTPRAMPRAALHAYDADDCLAAKAIYAKILWLRGYPDDAKTQAEQCLTEAMQVGHEQSICWTIVFNLCPVAIWRGDFGQAENLVSLLLERSQRVFEHYHDWGLLYRQFLSGTASGRVDEGFHMKAKIAAQADLFATFDVAFAGSDTLARVRADEDIWCAPELLRVWAYRLLSGGDKTAHGEAEATLLHSLNLARRQDAKSWELRTATTLALFYLRSGRIREARAALEPTLMQFKQGHDTRDFQTAISALSELSG